MYKRFLKILRVEFSFENEGFVSARLFVAPKPPILIHLPKQNRGSLKII